MDVEVGNTLADPVVDTDERTFGVDGILERLGNALGNGENGAQECGLKVEHGVAVDFRANEAVPGEERGGVEKDDHLLILIDRCGGDLAGDDPAENAGRIRHVCYANGPRSRAYVREGRGASAREGKSTRGDGRASIEVEGREEEPMRGKRL
jgi:hypothetical protein